MKSSSTRYYPHIDGLRALSILLVIVYHYQLGSFNGGYIGVDIFFTISGFLIIGSIIGLQERNQFRLIEFWLRRIRRLFPAITTTLILSLAVGFVLMNPTDYMHLSYQTVYSLFSIINFTLLDDVDYFELDESSEPLVHFWSLAVEEQFYLVFPLLAVFVFCKINAPNYRMLMVCVLIVLSVISLIISEYLLRSGENLFVYYMMPTRFAQLALGGVLAIYLQSPGRVDVFENNYLMHDFFVLLGLCIIIFVSIQYNQNTQFPGVNVILPTLGALAILASGNISRLSIIFENIVARYIGKLSFSLYLVHWPVWSYTNYYFNRTLEFGEIVLALTITFIISVFIYHFIECPVRFSPKYHGKKMFVLIRPMFLITLMTSASIILLNGMERRVNEEYREYVKTTKDFHREYFGGKNYKGNAAHYLGDESAQPDFIIFGDSKARQFAVGIDELLRELGRQAIMVVHDGCPFLVDIVRLKGNKPLQSCADISKKTLEIIGDNDLPVISMRSWTNYLSSIAFTDGNRIDRNAEGIEEWFANKHIQFHKRIRELVSPDRPIYVIGNNLGSKYALPIINCLSRPGFINQPCIPKSDYFASEYKMKEIEAMVADGVNKISNSKFIPMTSIYCLENNCGKLMEGNLILYSDSSHLSIHGARKFAPILLELTNLGFSQENKM